MNPDLEVEQYRQKWEYIRHTETIRNQVVGGLVLVTGGLLGFISRNVASIESIQGEWRAILALTLLLVLWLHSLLYLVFQKRNYNHYVEDVRRMVGDGRESGSFGPFGVYFSACAGATSLIAGLLSYAIEMTETRSESVALGFVVFAAALLGFVLSVSSTRRDVPAARSHETETG